MSDHSHDDWFRHEADESAPQAEHAAHVNTTAIGLTLLAIVFGVLFTVIILSMYFVQYAGTRKAMLEEGTRSAEPYLQYEQQATRELNRLSWADREAGTVYVPIDSAMDAVVEAYGAPGVRAAAAWHGPAKVINRAAHGSAHNHDQIAMEGHHPHE
jgi:hypothetical protein